MLDPVRQSAQALGHSAPTMHWWLSLTATDQGTWAAALTGLLAAIGGVAAAIASFRAARVALDISRSEEQRRHAEQLAKGRVIASYLYVDIDQSLRRVINAISLLEQARMFTNESAIDNSQKAKNLFQGMPIGKIEASLDKLVWLPPQHAMSLAALPDARQIVLNELTLKTAFPIPKDIHAISDVCVPQLRIIESGLRAFVDEYGPAFVEP